MTETHLPDMHESGTREELVTLLRERSKGWYYLCKDALSLEAHAGAEALEGGALSVRVGHTVYAIAETRDGGHTGG